MLNKFYAIALFLLAGTFGVSAQTSLQDLQKELDATKTGISDLETKRLDLEAQIKDFDLVGWKFGGAGSAGLSVAGSSNWFNAGESLTSFSGGISLFANNNQEKTFWNNWGNLKLGYIKSGNPISLDSSGTVIPIPEVNLLDWEKNLDELYLASLFGYKLSDKLAVSAMVDARTTFGNFFDNALVTAGAGITWLPNSDLTVVFHPLTYKGIFAKTNSVKTAFEFDPVGLEDGKMQSTGEFGAKIVVDYKKELWRNIVWTTNLTAFAPYSNFDNIEATWLNTFGLQLSKYLTLGLNYDLRYYKPETHSIIGGFVGETTQPIDYKNIIDSNDEFSYVQQRWLLSLNFATTFDITKLPTLGLK